MMEPSSKPDKGCPPLDGNELFTNSPNPLLIDLVFANIAQYLDFNSVKTARQVCKKWEELTFPNLRHRSIVVIGLKGDDDIKETEFINNLTKSFEEGKVFPNFQFRFPPVLLKPVVANWMARFGHCIKYLRLTEVVPGDGKNIYKFKYEIYSFRYHLSKSSLEFILCQWCTNLKALEIQIPQFAKDDDNIGHSENDLARRLVKLDHLALGCNVWNFILDDLEPIARKVFGFCKEIKSLTLQKAAIDGSLLTEEGEDYIKYPLNPFLGEDESLSTLEKLDLGVYPIHSDILWRLTAMPLTNLKSLVMGPVVNCNDSNDNGLPALVNFLDKVGPHLDHLELVEGSTSLGAIRRNVAGTNFYFEKLEMEPIPLSSFRLFSTEINVQINITSLNVAFLAWTPQTLNFLKNFQELKYLCLGLQENRYLDGDSSHTYMVSVPAVPKLSGVTLGTLERLDIDYILNSQSADDLVESFPNLKELRIRLPGSGDVAEHLFSRICVLDKLGSFELKVGNVPCLEIAKGLEIFLLYAESFISMKQLCISNNYGGCLSASGLSLGASLGLPLVEKFRKFPQFRILKFEGFQVGDDEFELLKMMEKNYKVKVEFVDCQVESEEQIIIA